MDQLRVHEVVKHATTYIIPIQSTIYDKISRFAGISLFSAAMVRDRKVC